MTGAGVVVVVLLAVGTWLLRAAGLLAAGRVAALPAPALAVLGLVAPAALAALVVPAVLRVDGELEPFGPRVLAAVVALLVALRTRSVVATLVAGLVVVVPAGLLLG